MPHTQIYTRVWDALATVHDPELDEPITELGFVASCTVSSDGTTTVELRLPTFFCAPNFSYLMAADTHDAISAVPGVTRAVVTLTDHHASTQINQGVAAHAGFVKTFTGQATTELHQLRTQFLHKAVLAGQDRVARPLVDTGTGPDQLAALTLAAVPPSPDLDRLRARRAALDLPHDDNAPLLIHPDGTPVPATEIPLHLRRARLQRVGIETNGQYCRSLLATRYPQEVSRP
jgi:metal-sulfur cluster biosynthetic enzyme